MVERDGVARVGEGVAGGGVVVGGQVMINGTELRGEVRRGIGYVAQECGLDSFLTVWEYLTLCAGIKLGMGCTNKGLRRRVVEALRVTGLEGIKDELIGDEVHGPRGISSGERRRVCIATELIMDPGVLIMDEPTCGLDARTALGIISLFNDLQLARPRVIVYTIHQPRTQIFHAMDRLLLLCKGQEVFQGGKP